MSRGQQGIGISAARMYGQLTTGKPIKITSKISKNKPAHYYNILINTTKNKPEIIKDIEIEWEKDHVTKVEIELEAKYTKGKQSIIDKDITTGKTERIDCTKFGSGAYSIPSSNERLSFETKSKFILAIETGGMFQRLQSHKFWEKANYILVLMGRVPTRATRRFIKKLSLECKIPVYTFVDCDPYGMPNIYRTLKVGSGNAAHINKFFCVPKAKFLGVTPQGIKDFDLPTHPLTETDIKRARDALKNDPFFAKHKKWQKALEQLIKMGVRAEQQLLQPIFLIMLWKNIFLINLGIYLTFYHNLLFQKKLLHYF